MTTLHIPIPDSLFAALRKAPHELEREMRIAAAIHWYQQSAVSMERAAEVAGMTRPEFWTNCSAVVSTSSSSTRMDLARDLERA